MSDHLTDWRANKRIAELEDALASKDKRIELMEVDQAQYEEEIERLTARVTELEEVIAVSDGLKCPNCLDEGFTAIQVGPNEWEQEQCEFCYTVPDSIFMRQAALKDEVVDHER